jgi:histidine ammonia-lyase
MQTLNIGQDPLTFADIEAVAFGHQEVCLTPQAMERINQASNYIRERAQSGDAIYGVTTGFGANRDKVIRPEDAEILQERLLISHACGLGNPLPEEVVRAMMLLRVNALSQGMSGIRLSTLQLLIDMLNRRVHPVVPEFGSVGASGDLCPLAHMCLPLIGLGEVRHQGNKLPGDQGLALAGLQPTRLTYKEGLALLNGTQAMTALGVVVVRRALQLIDCADAIGAMSLEAVAGRLEALDERIHHARRRPGQIISAAHVRKMLEGSELAGAVEGSIEGKQDYVQDSYCLRCMPQVHGASRDVLTHVMGILETEANAVTDNPLVFTPNADDPEGSILSGGNFHGQPVAMALDYLKVALAEIGNISERRCAKLTDKHFSEGLPAFLISNPGLNSGMMIPQYVAAALVSENKSRAHPASVDSIPTSANMEDHVSMGMHAGLHALSIVRNAEKVLGIEYLISAQALDLRTQLKAPATQDALNLLRGQVSFMHEDRVMYPDMEKAIGLIQSGRLAQVIRPWLALA